MFIKFLRYKLNIEEGHLVYISQHGNEYAECFQICHVITVNNILLPLQMSQLLGVVTC
jgi:hypothetical protein